MTNPIPDEALNSHIGILGKTGSGKTYTAKGLVERLLTARRQVVIIDPTGAWYGLRTGFEIPIFGGRHGDIEIGDKAGQAVAAVIVEQRASAIVDLSLMSGGAQRRFMTSFAHRLRQKPPGALWLVIDEADEFLPQQLLPEMANLFGDLKWMVRRGRLNGFRVMMVTQRPAEIAKAVLTQIETLVAHRLTAPQDRKAIEEWVKGHHAPEEAKEVLNSLASLERGVAWVWAPDLGILSRSQMPEIATFDSSRTPDADDAAVEPPALAALDMSAIREALATAEVPGAKMSPTEAANNGALALEIARLHDQIDLLSSERDSWRHSAQVRLAMIERARAALQANGDEIPANAGEGGSDDVDRSAARAPVEPEPPVARKAGRAEAAAPPRRSTDTSSAEGLTPAKQRVLDAIAWWKAASFLAVERRRACIMAGYSPKASTFGVYISELVRAGLVQVPEPGKLSLTEAGEEAANRPHFVTDGCVLDAARALLSPAEIKIFDEIVREYPGNISRAELADRVGLSRTASTLGVYLSKIGSFGFTEAGRGVVRAADWLFPRSSR